MKILIAYGTTEGQTRKIVETVAGQIRELGHDVQLFDTSRRQGDLHPETFDRILVAGSVHQQEHQDSVKVFVAANLNKISEKPTMFISVSLAAAFDDGTDEAQSYVDRFLSNLGWAPTETLMVAGALRYDEYDYFKDQIVAHVVLEGRTVAGPKGDHEFTDWDALANAVVSFVGIGQDDNAGQSR